MTEENGAGRWLSNAFTGLSFSHHFHQKRKRMKEVWKLAGTLFIALQVDRFKARIIYINIYIYY